MSARGSCPMSVSIGGSSRIEAKPTITEIPAESPMQTAFLDGFHPRPASWAVPVLSIRDTFWLARSSADPSWMSSCSCPMSPPLNPWFEGPTYEPREIHPDLADPHDLAIGGIDGDGNADEVTCVKGSYSVARRGNDGAGESEKPGIDDEQAAYAIRLVEIDTDDDLDVLVGATSRTRPWGGGPASLPVEPLCHDREVASREGRSAAIGCEFGRPRGWTISDTANIPSVVRVVNGPRSFRNAVGPSGLTFM